MKSHRDFSRSVEAAVSSNNGSNVRLSITCAIAYNVDALPDQTHYLGPTLALANPCQCNTVVYSLMSACGACQGRTYDSYASFLTLLEGN